MSQNDVLEEDEFEEVITDDALEEFRDASQGIVEADLGLNDDDHVMSQLLDSDDGHHSFTSDESVTGERFAFRYEQLDAFVREYLANAQTAVLRRARLELRETDESTYTDEWFNTHSIPEQLSTAERVADYTGLIEVTLGSANGSLPRFEISDNGIGISPVEFASMRKLGLSPNRDDGTVSGEFGQGIVSVFPAISKYGIAEFVTRDRRSEISFAEVLTIDGFKDADGTRDEYGTTWSLPSLSTEARDLDLEAAIDEYTTGMYVPVITSVYDDSDTLVDQHEHTYEPMESWVPDDAPVVTYEDEMIKAVASPAIGDAVPERRLLISFPIDAGDTGYVRSLPSEWQLSYRAKYEDGRVWQCTHDDADHAGLLPMEDIGYERLEAPDTADYTPVSALSEPTSASSVGQWDEIPASTDIVLPEPVDDRDRFRDHDGVLKETLGVLCRDQLLARAGEYLSQLAADGSTSAIYDLPPSAATLLVDACTEAGFDPSTATQWQTFASEHFDCDLPDQIAFQLGVGHSVELVDELDDAPLNDAAVNKDVNQSSISARKLAIEYGLFGNVYMGVSLSAAKCQVVWHSDRDACVVAVSNSRRYDVYEEAFGWQKLRDISLRNLDEWPSLPDDLRAELSRDNTGGGGGGVPHSQLPGEDRTIELRQDARGHYTEGKISDVCEAFANDNAVDMNGQSVSRLLVFRDPEVDSVTVGHDASLGAVARTIVPKYTLEYFEATPHCHVVDPDSYTDTVSQLQADDATTPVKTIPLDQFRNNGLVSPTTVTTTTTTVGALDPDTLVVVTTDTVTACINDNTTPDTISRGEHVRALLTRLRDRLDTDDTSFALDEYDSLVVTDESVIRETPYNWDGTHACASATEDSPTVVAHKLHSSKVDLPRAISTTRFKDRQLAVHVLLPETTFKRDTPEWGAVVNQNRLNIRRRTDRGRAIINILYELAESTDPGTAVFPSTRS